MTSMVDETIVSMSQMVSSAMDRPHRASISTPVRMSIRSNGFLISKAANAHGWHFYITARALGSYKDSVGVLVDTWGYLSADYADLENYADLERIVLDCLTREVIGCAMKVHPLLGCGFLEIVYDKVLAFELERKN